ncbi:hypothetical protein [Methylobacterium nodulans]|uniref:Uncharacterized protein n=1 Tax=Methylobacterium nodulans (strain LMG 21967 / CNCM I-2342 / ORS 2060) TaxID=460265 RepID=B8IRJ2_METNO|nr:hypothetical protein [Methylobacterium nodulans]ACL58732.1 hypothetical protein Mnod_3832 [Methylobacterium nodulans ORS 2060]
MSETTILLHEIEAFLTATRLAESTFGRKCVNDGKLVSRLREGRTVTLEKASAIRRFMREYRPPSPAVPAPSSPTMAEAAP